MNVPALVCGLILTISGVLFSAFFYLNNVGCKGKTPGQALFGLGW
jgi:hypothetical protein